MRICYVLQTAGGGVNQVVIDLSHYALSRGAEVTIVHSSDRVEPNFVAALGSLTKARIITSPMLRHVGMRDFRDGFLLLGKLRRFGPFDIIHAHSSKAGALVRAVSMLVPAPIVYTPHCFYSMTPNVSKLYAMVERFLSPFAASIVVVSQSELRHAEAIGISKNKLVSIPNGMASGFSVSREQVRNELQIGSETTVIGFVGRLDLQKNPIRAVQSFANIARQFANVRLLIVGDGRLRQRVQAESAACNLGDRISFLGYRDARAIIPAIDCLLCSSDFEGLPIIFLEALTAGIPIVSTPVGGADEAIIRGVTGYIAETCSVEDLTNALRNFLELSSARRLAMSEACLRQSKLFTTDIMGQRHFELYRELMKH